MEQNSTYEQWVQDRDKWYITTLTDHGCHIDDILAGKWEQLHITLKVNMNDETETLYIKDRQVGESHKMHPTYTERIRQANQIQPKGES